jgi:UDP-N-acetylmuramate--alanine ligase
VIDTARRVHFIGIGGSGMSGLAELLVNLGHTVSGSDLQKSDVTERLASLGVRVRQGHAPEYLGEADLVVVSSAVRPTNPELLEAERRQIPVLPRAEMLAELMRRRSGIAIAGAHGKTTTSSMIAIALERAGLDPTVVIGGRTSTLRSNARVGRGPWMVAEADESDRSFLRLSPKLAVLTNIDHEHLEAYRGFDDLLQTFVDFANRVPADGAVVLCADDPHLRAIRPKMTGRVVTYAIEAEADFTAHDILLDGLRSSCTVRRRMVEAQTGRAADLAIGRLRLSVPGRHNLQNALAAVAVGAELAVPFETLALALEEFRGAERRFQVLGVERGVTVVDDYGHHPTEIRAVLAAARVQHPVRIIVVFQPHRFTRTRELLAEFGRALAEADAVILTDIYAAGEDPIADITVDAVAAAVRAAGQADVHVVRALDDIPPQVSARARAGDLVVMMGAGSIGSSGPKVLEALRTRG